MDAQRADGVTDEIAEEGVLVLRRLDGLAAPGIDRREDEAAVHGEGETRREEERDRNHVRGVVVEVAIGIAGVRYPIEVAHDPVREAMAPGAHKERADDDECDIGKDRNAEGDGYVKPHAELAGYLDLPESPGDEGTDRADGNQLPDATIGHRGEL